MIIIRFELSFFFHKDLGAKDLKREQVYMVCQIVRVGQFSLCINKNRCNSLLVNVIWRNLMNVLCLRSQILTQHFE